MRVIIAGGRDFDNVGWSFPLLDRLLRKYDKVTVLCGEANGADEVGKVYAFGRSHKVESHPAKWDKHGKAEAGKTRNVKMAKKARMLIAFWDGKSRGTKHMIRVAKIRGLKVKVVRYRITKKGKVKELKPSSASASGTFSLTSWLL